MPNIARVVQRGPNGWIVLEFPIQNIIPALRVRGFAYRGDNQNPAQRAELQGQPQFVGLLGPMWDGDAIRYENQAAYNAHAD